MWDWKPEAAEEKECFSSMHRVAQNLVAGTHCNPSAQEMETWRPEENQGFSCSQQRTEFLDFPRPCLVKSNQIIENSTVELPVVGYYWMFYGKRWALAKLSAVYLILSVIWSEHDCTWGSYLIWFLTWSNVRQSLLLIGTTFSESILKQFLGLGAWISKCQTAVWQVKSFWIAFRAPIINDYCLSRTHTPHCKCHIFAVGTALLTHDSLWWKAFFFLFWDQVVYVAQAGLKLTILFLP